MYEVTKSFHFDAGHALTHHNGLCRRPHGHTYTLIIKVRSSSLIDQGSSKNMVLDFQEIVDIVNPMIKKYFDHHWLNDTLETDSPTAEFMASWIYAFLKPQIPGLYCVSLYETPTSQASYWE